MREVKSPQKIKTDGLGFLTGGMIIGFIAMLVPSVLIFAFGLIMGSSLTLTVAVSSFPIIGYLLYCIIFVYKRPPGYQLDFISSMSGDNSLRRPKKKKLHIKEL
jgi:hypothetical protein